MAEKPAFWTWSNRIEFLWSLIEKIGIWVGGAVLVAAGPTGHVIGGLEALYYVIPLSALGVALLVVGFRRRSRHRDLPAPVSPRRREYTRERIAIADLAYQYDGTLRDITFIECEIMGPAVLCGAGGNISIYYPHLVAASEDSPFIDLPSRKERPDGAIGIRDCIFKECWYYRISWALPR